ncbi:MAG: hypothetical protein JXX14_18605 [Deltaproteobacteria bacterium]|nr:hypothetical protein [Deltaproteobacteria bacterium]
MQQISPSHPLIRYTGRVDFSNPLGPVFSHSGVSIRIRFTGRRLHIRLDNPAIHRAPDITNYFNVVVDGAAPVMLQTTSEQKSYVLAKNLADCGEHEVVLFKRTESSPAEYPNAGKVTVRGISIDDGATLLRTKEQSLRMEFIGDSIVCGYGNGLSKADPIEDHYTTLNANAWMAFGPIAARAMNAAYVAVAYSGRGMVRNFGGRKGQTVPDMYLCTIPDDPGAAPWRPEFYVPDIIVINLGTNDFSEGVGPQEALDALEMRFAARYQSFIEELTGYYSNATFILTVGPMISDQFPAEYFAQKRVRRTLKALVAHFRSRGYSNVHWLAFPRHRAPFGEDYHPTIATHRKMANRLVRFIESLKHPNSPQR